MKTNLCCRLSWRWKDEMWGKRVIELSAFRVPLPKLGSGQLECQLEDRTSFGAMPHIDTKSELCSHLDAYRFWECTARDRALSRTFSDDFIRQPIFKCRR